MMPKVHEEIVILKVYKLIKPGTTIDTIITEDIAVNIAAVAEELVGDGVVIEVEKS